MENLNPPLTWTGRLCVSTCDDIPPFGVHPLGCPPSHPPSPLSSLPSPHVIGVCGYKRAGKDEVFRALRQRYQLRAARLAFADPLKDEVAHGCGVTTAFIEEHKDAFRLGLQWWGTDFRRNLFGHDYWISKLELEFTKLVRLPVLDGLPVRLVVFTDCRFPNELALVRKLGGKIWRVARADKPHTDDPHPSERALDNHNPDRLLLSHQGTLEDFHARILAAYAEDFQNGNN